MITKSETAAATATPAPDTTQEQAIAYMNNEIIWANIIVMAWQDSALMSELKANADNVNAIVIRIAKQLGMTGTIPDGVTLKVAFDTPTSVNLLMPVVQFIPPGPLDMVPHSL